MSEQQERQGKRSKDYHCCATCEHFLAQRTDAGVRTRCRRLGYETKPFYQFACWQPTPRVADLIRKQRSPARSPQE